MKLSKQQLNNLYITHKKSVADIARIIQCSENKINYWMRIYRIPKRSIADAIYLKHNPNGDPFMIYEPKTMEEAVLFGLGIGLYWGEGTKANTHSIRLGNTDPRLIKKFIDFLEKIYGIDRKKLHFGLQIFSDISPSEAIEFWQHTLAIPPVQFQKPVITPPRGTGTYRHKLLYGVLTVYFNNKKLRDIICQTIKNMK